MSINPPFCQAPVVVWTGGADCGGVNAVAFCRIGSTKPTARRSKPSGSLDAAGTSSPEGCLMCFVGTGKGVVIAVDITQDSSARSLCQSTLDWQSSAAPVRQCQQVGHHNGFVSCALPVGNLIFTGSVDGSIRCWRLNSDRSTEIVAAQQDHEGPVHRLAFDSSTTRLFSASSDCTLRAWDLRVTGSNGRNVIRIFESEVHSCECFPGADCVACGLQNGSVLFIRPSSGEILREVKGKHDGIVTSMQKALLCFSDLLEQVKAQWTSRDVRASRGEGVTAEVQEVLDIIPFHALKESILSALVDDGKDVLLELSRGFPNRIKVTIEHGQSRSVQEGQWGPKTEKEAAAMLIRCDKPAPTLLTTSRDETTKLWDICSGQCLVTVGGPQSSQSMQNSKANRLYCTLSVGGGRAFLTAGTDGVIRRWNVRTGALEHEYCGHTSTIFCLAQDEESGCLVSCSSDRTVRLWCPAEQCEFCPFQCPCGQGCRTHEVQLMPPGPPIKIETVGRDASIYVTWAAPLDDGNADILRYEVWAERWSDSFMMENVLKVDGTETSCRLAGLKNGTGYNVHVVAVNSEGKGPTAVGLHVVTPIAPPAAPTDLSCEVDFLTGALQLTWTGTPEDKCGGSAIVDYMVHYHTDAHADHEDDAAGQLSMGLATRCKLPGSDKPGQKGMLVTGQRYRFTVTALNAAGESLESNPCAGTPAPAKCLPMMPRCLQSLKLHDARKIKGVHSNCGIDESIVQLSWEAPESDGGSEVLSYRVNLVRTGSLGVAAAAASNVTHADDGEISCKAATESMENGFCKILLVEKAGPCEPYIDLGLGLDSSANLRVTKDEIQCGKGMPPELHVQAKLLADQCYQYHFTVSAITSVGRGPEANWATFGPVRDLPVAGGRKSMAKRHSLPRLTKASSKASGPQTALRASLRVNASSNAKTEATQRSSSSGRSSGPAINRNTSLPRLGSSRK